VGWRASSTDPLGRRDASSGSSREEVRCSMWVWIGLKAITTSA